jgi:hypothetical protein
MRTKLAAKIMRTEQHERFMINPTEHTLRTHTDSWKITRTDRNQSILSPIPLNYEELVLRENKKKQEVELFRFTNLSIKIQEVQERTLMKNDSQKAKEAKLLKFKKTTMKKVNQKLMKKRDYNSKTFSKSWIPALTKEESKVQVRKRRRYLKYQQ